MAKHSTGVQPFVNVPIEQLFVLVVGNVIDGIELIGTFDNAEIASHYAEIHCKSVDWSIALLQKPLPIGDLLL